MKFDFYLPTYLCAFLSMTSQCVCITAPLVKQTCMIMHQTMRQSQCFKSKQIKSDEHITNPDSLPSISSFNLKLLLVHWWRARLWLPAPPNKTHYWVWERVQERAVQGSYKASSTKWPCCAEENHRGLGLHTDWNQFHITIIVIFSGIAEPLRFLFLIYFNLTLLVSSV